jgi:CTP:molybdopterin cytidylyltransferase MocA
MMATKVYPVVVLCGRDRKRRELLRVHDPEGKYPSKALLPMLGKRVIDWQLEALQASSYVGEIYLLGLTQSDYPIKDPIHHIPIDTTSTILEKISAGSKIISKNYPDLKHIIISTGDTPAITTKSIDLFFRELIQHSDADVLLTGVPEDITLEIFPDHGRVVGRFKDQDIYLGEMFALRYDKLPILEEEIDQLATRRLQFNRRADTSKLGPILRYLARKPGLWLMIIKYLRGILTIGELERVLSKVYKLNIKTAIIPDPGFGMDLDLPEDYQKLSDYIKQTKLSSNPEFDY